MKNYTKPSIGVYKFEDVCQIIRPTGPNMPPGSPKLDINIEEDVGDEQTELRGKSGYWSNAYWD